MKIEKFVLGPVGTNCYIVQNEEAKECFLVDLAACPREFTEYIRQSGMEVKAVFLTHGHFDHIMGLNDFCGEFSVPVYAFEGEREMMESAKLNASVSMIGQSFSFAGSDGLKDGQEIEIAGMKIHVIHTPGHTSGGCCYYLPEEGVLFSGDTLFCGSVGRTDLPTGSMGDLVRSVKEKLFALPDDTRVYPGHMEDTSIGYEKKYNPFI